MLIEKGDKTGRREAKKKKKKENAAVCVTTQNSSRPKELCHNQQLNVVTKLRHNSIAEREIYVAIKSFSVATLLKKIVKKTVATILYSVAKKIKIESKEAVSRQYNFCHNIKS